MAKGYGLAASASAISYINYIPRMSPTSSSAASTSDRLTTVLSYGALLLLIYLVFRIVEPFLEPLAWSGVLAIIFYPAHQRIMRRLQPNRAALVSTVGVTVLLIVPALVVLVLYGAAGARRHGTIAGHADGSGEGFAFARGGVDQAPAPARLAGHGFFGTAAPGRGKSRIVSGIAIGGAGEEPVQLFCGFVHSYFRALFHVPDGDEIVRGAGHLLPFDEGIQEEMLRESRDLIFASVAVALVIAVLQGVLGGLAFTVGGFPRRFSGAC